MRPFRFATQLRELGWQPLVVCFATPGEALSDRERRLSHGIERIELGVPFDRTRRRASGELGRIAGARGGGNGHAASPAARRAPWFAGLLDRVDAHVPVDAWAPVLAWHARALLPRLRAATPSLVFSTADPWSSHLLGGSVARALGVPWIADFRDPWTLCPVRGQGPRLARLINCRVERRMLQHASRVTFTTRSTLARYAAAYPEAAQRMVCIPNGFDAALLADPVSIDLERTPAEGPLRLCFFGRFRPLSPASPITRALALLAERSPAYAPRIRVSAVGELPEADAALARRLGVLEQFEVLAPVAYEQSLGVLRRHDVSLLSTAPGRDDIVPAKLWDYLAAGRPILSLGANPEVEQRLAELSAGVQLAPGDAAAAAELLARCIESKARSEPLPIPARPPKADARLAEFESRRLTQQLAELFEATLASAGR